MHIKKYKLVFILVFIVSLNLCYAQSNTKYKYKNDLPGFGFNKEKIQHLKKELKKGDSFYLNLHLAQEYLNAGLSEKSSKLLEKIKKHYPNEIKKSIFYDKLRVLVLLRKGEELNCCARPDINFCTFPIEKKYRYLDVSSSKKLLKISRKLQIKYPNESFFVWAEQLAMMTSGIDTEEVFAFNQLDSKRDTKIKFENVAHNLGLDVYGLAGGSVMDDFNNDGYLDIVCTDFEPVGQLKFFLNDGDGQFVDQTEKAGLLGNLGGLNIVQWDYNNDGWLDLFVPKGSWYGKKGCVANSVLRNNKDGTFTDVTEKLGFTSESPTQVVVVSDFNNDGWLDVFIGNESRSNIRTKSQFYQNKKGKYFEEVTDHQSFELEAFVKGADWGYINDDDLPDLYVSCLGEKNYTLINKSERNKIKFVKKYHPEMDLTFSFPCWFWDYNNDGKDDLYVASYKLNHKSVIKELLDHEVQTEFPPRLFENRGNNQFVDMSAKKGLTSSLLSMGANYGDFDNNGFLDIYLGTGSPSFESTVPNRMFFNFDGKFEEVTASARVGHLQKGHGISIGDIDNDGDQDIYSVFGGAHIGDKFYNSLYINNCNQVQNTKWITLRFRGKDSNSFGIGNKIKVVLQKKNSTKDIYRHIDSGGSFGSSSLQCEIGFEADYSIKKIEVYWPTSKIKQVFTNLESNNFYTINEGQSMAQKSNAKAINYIQD